MAANEVKVEAAAQAERATMVVSTGAGVGPTEEAGVLTAAWAATWVVQEAGRGAASMAANEV